MAFIYLSRTYHVMCFYVRMYHDWDLTILKVEFDRITPVYNIVWTVNQNVSKSTHRHTSKFMIY